MSPYTSVAIVIGLFGGGCILGYEYATYKAKSDREAQQIAQDNVTITAQNSVIKTQQKQTIITEKTNEAYHTGIAAIDAMYNVTGVQPIQTATSNNIRSVPNTTCGVQTTKVYKLTLKQCDMEEAKANALWNWTNQQAVLIK